MVIVVLGGLSCCLCPALFLELVFVSDGKARDLSD